MSESTQDAEQKNEEAGKPLRFSPVAVDNPNELVGYDFTKDDLAKPVHTIIAETQAEAALTLKAILKDDKTPYNVRRQAALDLLGLGGNSADMLKLSAMMTGKGKDISTMSNEELEAFIVDAKRQQTALRDKAASTATLVEGEVVKTAENSHSVKGQKPHVVTDWKESDFCL